MQKNKNAWLAMTSSTWFYDLLFLTIGIAIVYGIFLGHRPLSVPDEARYAEIPREMLALHDFVTPHLNFVKYFEKPPLFYWLQVGAIKLFGVNEWAVRIPNTFMALLGCLFTYGIGRFLYDRRTGILGALILASSSLYFVLGHLVTLDMTLTTMITGCLFCFLASAKLIELENQKNLCLLATYGIYIFAALALLTKGLVGIFFPAGIIFIWLLLFNQWHLLKSLRIPTGILIFLIIAVPWHLLVQWKNPEFFNFYFINQQFIRYFTLDSGRYQPAWFFIPTFALGFLPWVLFLIPALQQTIKNCRQHFQKEKYSVFLILWAALIFIFFSLSHSKLIPYILPIFPPLAVITANYFAKQWDVSSKTLRICYLIFLALLIIGGIGVLVVQHFSPVAEVGFIKTQLEIIFLIWTSGTLISIWLINHQYPKRAFQVFLISTFLAYIIIPFAIPKVDQRSIYPLAIKLKSLLQPNDIVVAFDKYYQDLPFYLRQRVIIVDTVDEMEFGTYHQNTRAWMIKQPTFWPLWDSKQRVYMVLDRDTYHDLLKANQHHFYLLAQTTTNVLVVNQPTSTKLNSRL